MSFCVAIAASRPTLDAVEVLERSVFGPSEDRAAGEYRDKVYNSVLGHPVTFGRVKDQRWLVIAAYETASAEASHGPAIGALFLSVRPSAHCAYVAFIAVDELFRKRGVARLLLKHAFEKAESDCAAKQLEYMFLTCHDDLVPFYEALGFAPLDRHYRHLPRNTQKGLNVLGQYLFSSSRPLRALTMFAVDPAVSTSGVLRCDCRLVRMSEIDDRCKGFVQIAGAYLSSPCRCQSFLRPSADGSIEDWLLFFLRMRLCKLSLVVPLDVAVLVAASLLTEEQACKPRGIFLRLDGTPLAMDPASLLFTQFELEVRAEVESLCSLRPSAVKRDAEYADTPGSPSREQVSKWSRVFGRRNASLMAYVSDSNHGELVRSLLPNAILSVIGPETGITDIQFVSSWDDCGFIWKPSTHGVDGSVWRSLDDCPFGLMNHLPRHYYLSTKDELLRSVITSFGARMAFEAVCPLCYAWRPARESLRDLLEDMRTFSVRGRQYHLPPSFGTNWWIVKPASSFGGQGIRVLSSLKEVEHELNALQQQKGRRRDQDCLIIQKYLERPLLYAGKKFDLRLFALVVPSRRQPDALHTFFFVGGYARLSSQQFSLQADSASALTMHLTNTCFQNSGKDKPTSDHLHVNVFDLASSLGFDPHVKIFQPVVRILRRLLDRAGRDLNRERYRCGFELFGCDFILDENVMPWLLEVNTNCSLATDSAVTKAVIPQVLSGCLSIVCHNRVRSIESMAVPGQEVFGFEYLGLL
jgi:GNAT superfamily N-acetyltransferase